MGAIHLSQTELVSSNDSKSAESLAVSTQKPTFCQRLNSIISQITIEPMMLFHAASMMMMYVIAQSLKLYKVCRGTFGHSDEICRNLSAFPEFESESQKVASDLGMYWAIVQTVPSTIFTIFLGPWSDLYGRKIPMLIPLAGAILSSIVYVLSAHFDELPPEFLLLGAALTGISGGISALVVAVFSYISDISNEKERTLRMAFVYGLWFMGSPIGSALGGVIKKFAGYKAVFLVGGGLLTFCLVYVIVRIKDVTVRPEKSESICKEICNLNTCKESFQACLKPRPDKKRTHLWLLTFCMSGLFLPLVGEGNVRFLYTRLKFDWKDETFSYYVAANMGVGAFGIIVILPILTKKAKMNDVTIALIAIVARIASEFLVAFSVAGWMMFFAAVPNFLGDCTGPPIRSMMSKCVAPNEVGKMFTMLAVVDAGLPILSGVMYSKVYNATMHVFPGTVFLVTAFIFTFVMFTLIWLYFDLIRLKRTMEKKSPPTEEKSNEEKGLKSSNATIILEKNQSEENSKNIPAKEKENGDIVETPLEFIATNTLQITHL